jgi:hypothetical protein
LSELGRTRGHNVALVGERGTGRRAVGAAWLAEQSVEEITQIDASLARIDPQGFLAALSTVTAKQGHGVVLANLDAVPTDMVASVIASLDGAKAVGIHVIGTFNSLNGRPGTSVLDWFEEQVSVPSLAERRDDVALLLEHLSWRQVDGLRRNRWASDVVQTVARADWPTNVAGLAALVQRVVTGPEMVTVTAAHLPASVRARASRRKLVGLERVEAQAIMEALDAADGNKKAAADALGIARSTLYRKVRALGIDLSGSTF